MMSLLPSISAHTGQVIKITLFRLYVAITSIGLLLSILIVAHPLVPWSIIQFFTVVLAGTPLALLLPAAITPRRVSAALNRLDQILTPVSGFAVATAIGMLCVTVYSYWTSKFDGWNIVIYFGSLAWAMVGISCFRLWAWAGE